MSNAGRILVVEDHETERRAVSQILKSEGFTVYGAENADKALSYIDENVDVVLSDLHMGDVSGLQLLQLWKKRRPETQFILLTGHSSVDSAVEAIKSGAYDYLTKPINPDELVLLIRRAVETLQKDKEIDNLRRRLDQKFGLDAIIGQSKPMKEVFAKIQRAAPVDCTVLILGENGTGKELVSQALHHNSPRKKGPFVAVNCAAVPATLVESELFGHVRGAFTGATDRRIGRFEQADGGTLFIDEIGDFELGLQAKLLRVLETLTFTPVGGHEDKKVDVRVIAATSRDVPRMVQEGKFREDLYYRLNVVTIQLPPLRERTDDISVLVDHFLKEISERKHISPHRLSPEVMRRFMAYRWPGNVRELHNVIERLMIMVPGDTIGITDLAFLDGSASLIATEPGAPPMPLAAARERFERDYILRTLAAQGGNMSRTADALGVERSNLYRKMRAFGIAPVRKEEEAV